LLRPNKSQTALPIRDLQRPVSQNIFHHETSLSNTILPLESIAFRAIPDLKPDTLIDIISSHHSPDMQLAGTLSHLTSQQNIRLHTAAPHLETLDIDIARPPTDHTSVRGLSECLRGFKGWNTVNGEGEGGAEDEGMKVDGERVWKTGREEWSREGITELEVFCG
jgi:hypothetical protein